MCRAHTSFCRMLSRKLPMKTLLPSIAWVFTYSLSITQPLQLNPTINTGYKRLNKITIKFGTELKSTKHIVVNYNFTRYIYSTSNYGIWYSRVLNECLARYSVVDSTGGIDDRKSTSGGYFYLRNNFVSWMSKKQNSVSLSTAEVEYIAAGSCCAQLLWMKKLLHDYGITQDTLCVFYDNMSAINLSKNPIQFNTRNQSISRSGTTSFETWWRRRLCV